MDQLSSGRIVSSTLSRPLGERGLTQDLKTTREVIHLLIRNVIRIETIVGSGGDLWSAPVFNSTTMILPSLHLDILLTVFRDLDIVDVVRIGMVSPNGRWFSILSLVYHPPPEIS